MRVNSLLRSGGYYILHNRGTAPPAQRFPGRSFRPRRGLALSCVPAKCGNQEIEHYEPTIRATGSPAPRRQLLVLARPVLRRQLVAVAAAGLRRRAGHSAHRVQRLHAPAAPAEPATSPADLPAARRAARAVALQPQHPAQTTQRRPGAAHPRPHLDHQQRFHRPRPPVARPATLPAARPRRRSPAASVAAAAKPGRIARHSRRTGPHHRPPAGELHRQRRPAPARPPLHHREPLGREHGHRAAHADRGRRRRAAAALPAAGAGLLL